MDMNLYIHSIEVELNGLEKCMNNSHEEKEDNIIYGLHIKVENDKNDKKNEIGNEKIYETPWYICIKNGVNEMCMMSYEMNISHAFNILDSNETQILLLYILRKDMKTEKVEYIHRHELNIKDKKYYDKNNCIYFENNTIKGKIKLYLKNGIIYNHLLDKIKSDEYYKDILLKRVIQDKNEEQLKNEKMDQENKNSVENFMEKPSQDDNDFSRNKNITNDFNEILNARKTLYWVYLDDDNNEQGPFNSQTIFNWILNEYFEDNTLIRLHDKKKFYKLYEIIDCIEKNVLLNTQNEDVSNKDADEKIVENVKDGDYENECEKIDEDCSKKNQKNEYVEEKEGSIEDGNAVKIKENDIGGKCINDEKKEENNDKNKKNVKKKNKQVKVLKRELKKIKEEMVKLKENNSNEMLKNEKICEKGKTIIRQNNDIIKNEYENKENNKKNGDYNEILNNFNDENKNSDIQTIVQNLLNNTNYNNYEKDYDKNDHFEKYLKEYEKSTNNVYKKNYENIEKSFNDYNIQDYYEKKKGIEIVMSSINQAQECILNIRKKKVYSYLNRIINLTIRDQSIYINNDETNLDYSEYLDFENNPQNFNIQSNTNYVKCLDKYKPTMITQNDNENCILKYSGKNSGTNFYIKSINKFEDHSIVDSKNSKSKIGNYEFKSKNYIDELNGNKKNKSNKSKVEETTTICFNISGKNSDVKYSYNVSYNELLKNILFIQSNIKKWLKKRQKWKMYNLNKSVNESLNKIKNVNNSIHNDIYHKKMDYEQSNSKIDKNKIKNCLLFNNYWNKNSHCEFKTAIDTYKPYYNISDQKEQGENNKIDQDINSKVYSILQKENIIPNEFINIDNIQNSNKKEEDSRFCKLRNADYIFKKIQDMNKYYTTETGNSYNKNLNVPLNKHENKKHEKEEQNTSLKREHTEMANEIYNIKSDNVNIDSNQTNINKSMNFLKFSDVLNKYKNYHINQNNMDENVDNFKNYKSFVNNLNKYNYTKDKEDINIVDKMDKLFKRAA
ncbi:hypothetical protein YYG_00129 [Plasmodium vinckei petteri]|uniref:GYF domain-containing protein n=1 Tax=Plasmodium vinckei petteri TaxID=138298 RepID=W7AL24_PLAVN|nr:hypothetical protein YYG_00129 [Plasmodium vinckei petteri]CAD2113114.1 conserved Plasmodium protein, unknown function [Plasmodium vinckei petteri]